MNSQMRVLHITPWYPTPSMPGNGIFIKRHIDAIGKYAQQQVLHIDLARDKQLNASTEDDNLIRISACVKSPFWRWYEYKYYRLLKSQLEKIDAVNQFTHVIFHIAYPSLIYKSRLDKYLPKKKLISEHWSAYNFNFHSTNRLNRIEKIFSYGLPLTVVSNTLGSNIQKFARLNLNFEVIPNIVQPDFCYKPEIKVENYFFTAALWKTPKVPLDLLNAISFLKSQGIRIQLHIAGDGPLLKQMEFQVKNLNLEDRIFFLGRLNSVDLAVEMNKALAFLMPTEFETFSVACAEALVCGCPVIANKVGAIPELVNSSNGFLIDENNSWEKVLSYFNSKSFDRKNIAANNAINFHEDKVASAFIELLKGLK